MRFAPKSTLRRNRREDGAALLLTLLVVSLLTTMILEFDFATRNDLRAAAQFRDATQAYFLADAGVSAAEALLKNDTENSDAYDGLDEIWATPVTNYPVGAGSVDLSITDESGKINVNGLVTSAGNMTTGRFDRIAQMKRLFEALEVDPNLVDAVVDWIDTDPSTMPYGAESGYYESLPRPYACKDAPMAELEELHLVKGITDEIYAKISPYLTVSSKSPYYININTAPAPVLRSLDDGIDLGAANRIIENRPYKTLAPLSAVVGSATVAQITGLIGTNFKSSVFSVRSEGKVNETRRVVQAIVLRPSTLLRYRVD